MAVHQHPSGDNLAECRSYQALILHPLDVFISVQMGVGLPSKSLILLASFLARRKTLQTAHALDLQFLLSRHRYLSVISTWFFQQDCAKPLECSLLSSNVFTLYRDFLHQSGICLGGPLLSKAWHAMLGRLVW